MRKSSDEMIKAEITKLNRKVAEYLNPYILNIVGEKKGKVIEHPTFVIDTVVGKAKFSPNESYPRFTFLFKDRKRAAAFLNPTDAYGEGLYDVHRSELTFTINERTDAKKAFAVLKPKLDQFLIGDKFELPQLSLYESWVPKAKERKPKNLRHENARNGFAPDGDYFTWGRVVSIHRIAEFAIVEYIDRGASNAPQEPPIHSFSLYIDNKSQSRSFSSLDKALIGAMVLKYQGINSDLLGVAFERSLEMETYEQRSAVDFGEE